MPGYDGPVMLTRERILRCLELLGSELGAIGARGELLMAGGASMCLVHEARDATMDVDAIYEPREPIAALVRKIAESEGLPGDWLNDAVKGFIAPDAPRDYYLSLPNLDVYAVSPEYLLAMKLMAAREELDLDDVIFLMRKLEISTVESASQTLLKFFHVSTVPANSWLMLEHAAEVIGAQKGPRVPSPGP